MLICLAQGFGRAYRGRNLLMLGSNFGWMPFTGWFLWMPAGVEPSSTTAAGLVLYYQYPNYL